MTKASTVAVVTFQWTIALSISLKANATNINSRKLPFEIHDSDLSTILIYQRHLTTLTNSTLFTFCGCSLVNVNTEVQPVEHTCYIIITNCYNALSNVTFITAEQEDSLDDNTHTYPLSNRCNKKDKSHLVFPISFEKYKLFRGRLDCSKYSNKRPKFMNRNRD